MLGWLLLSRAASQLHSHLVHSRLAHGYLVHSYLVHSCLVIAIRQVLAPSF